MADTLRKGITNSRVVAWRNGVVGARADRLAGEEPMEVRVAGPGQEPTPVAVTMRTPGNDFELACGFLVTEGLVGAGDIARVAYCDTVAGDEQRFNVVTVRTRTPARVGPVRNFYATSSCGVCGKASLDRIEVLCAPAAPGPVVTAATLLSLPETLRASQRVFDATGGLHAAGLFDPGGDLVAAREDVGRHNAVDKLVGRLAMDGGLPATQKLLLVSGRTGFEIVQKAAVAGLPIVCSVSAPSSLAVAAADRFGMTLVGFLRDGSFNVYCGEERIDLEA